MRFFTSFLLVVACTTFSYTQLVISEIMYNPPESGADVYEFVEVYNNGSNAVNLLGYSFTAGFEYTFTTGFNLGAGEYVLFAGDSVAFAQAFGVTAFQFTSGGLSNGGELVQLSDDMGNVVDEVDYDDGGGWPAAADGAGASIVLCDFNADNNDPANWDDAITGTGVISGGVEIFANPGAASNCGSGAEVRFLSSNTEVSEDVGMVTISVEISNAATTTLSVDVVPNVMSSTATIGTDVMISATTLNFNSGAAVDTMDVTFSVVDDADIEMIESLVLDLANPSSGVTINGVGSSTEVLIADNDAVIADIVINEIMYSPPGTDSDYEYLELYNNDDVSVDLSGYYFSEGLVDTLPDLTLAPGDFLVLAVDSVAFESTYGVTAFEWDSGSLSNGGETLELRDALGNVVDVVEYDNGGDWPEEANGDGPSLVLCDPSTDNNDPASWIAAVQPTGVFISGSEILGSPGAINDCIPPEPQGYTSYNVADVTSINENGVADSLGTRAELVGIVYGGNLRPDGAQFTIIDAAGDGIATFSDDDGFGYTVTEGDEVTLRGTVSQFNGLIQLNLDTIIPGSSANPLVDSEPVTVLDESTESQLVQIDGVQVTDVTTAGGGLNVTVTDGNTDYLVRIDFDTGITEDFINALGVNTLRITGLGGQFDSSEPFTEGYQLLPRYEMDIEIVSSVVEPAWGADLSVYPNPAHSQVRVELGVSTEMLVLKNYLGQTVKAWQEAGTQHVLDLSELPNGLYALEVIANGERVVRTIVKQ